MIDQNVSEIPPVGAAWAKAVGANGVHPLVCHVLDTAAAAQQLWSFVLGPVVRSELAAGLEPLGSVVEWACVFAGLHDLGKYSPAFQQLRIDHAEVRLGPMAASDLRYVLRRKGAGRVDTLHGLITAFELSRLIEAWGATPRAARLIGDAVGGHHGYLPGGQEIEMVLGAPQDHGQDRWRSWREDLVEKVVAACGLPEPASLPWEAVELSEVAAIGLAGLTSVSDWIASDVTKFPLAGDVEDIVEYRRSSIERARAAVADGDFAPWTPPADTGYRALFPGEVPRAVQVVVEKLLVGRAEPTLLVIEAPTGEGKTKTGLQAAATLVRDLGAAGIYYGVPTRAISDQVIGVVQDMLTNVGSDAVPRLNYSGAVNTGRGAVTPSGIAVDDDDDDGGADVEAQDWFVSKRSLLATIGVGTVDQLLKTAIRSGHGFVRLAALSNKVVVIDEVHAYDIHMSRLLDRLLTWLGRFGVSVVMLSATLPTNRRGELVSAWQSGLNRCLADEVPAIPEDDHYPRITVVGTGPATVASAAVSEINRDRRIVLEQVPDDEVIDWILRRAKTGSVAVVHNMVYRAVDTFTALESRIADLPVAERPLLIAINGQLAADLRKEAEGELRARFGPDGSRTPAIVVGTQVLEQSLDLDFDAMLSDVAPVDSLIQRAGRLHRHRRDPRRGPAVLGVTGIVEGSAGPMFPQYLRSVYSMWVLLRTWALLRERSALELPDDAPVLVDLVYGAATAVSCPAGWERVWADSETKHHRAASRDGGKAEEKQVPLPDLEELSELTGRRRNPGGTRLGRGRR